MHENRMSRRRLLAGLGAVGLGVVAVACGQGGEAPVPGSAPQQSDRGGTSPQPGAGSAAQTQAGQTPAAQQPASGAQVKGKVRWLVRSAPQENKGQAAVLDPMLKEKLPNVEFERIIVPQNQYIAKINSMAAARESLEIWGFGGNYYDYWARGLPQDLTGYISADKWNIDEYFQPGLMDVYKIHGKYYGLAQLTTYGSIMVYNRNMLDQAGLKPPPVKWDDKDWTFDKMLEMAQKMTKNPGKPDGQYGVRMQLWTSMISFPYLWGGDAWVPEHYKNMIAERTNFNSDAVIDSHQYKQDLIYKHKVSPNPSADQGLAQIGSPFKTGRVGMEMDGGWLFWTTSDIADFKIGYAALPTAKTNKHINFTDFWIMGRWSENKDAAWQVMRALTSVEATTRYSQQSGTPPTVRESLQPWLETVSKHSGQSVEDLVTLIEGAVDPKIAQESADHIFLQHPKINDTYNQEVGAIWNNKGTAKEIIPTIARRLDEVVLGIYNQFKDSIPKE